MKQAIKVTEDEQLFVFQQRKAFSVSGSVVITIPSQWCSHHGVRGGDTLKASMDHKQRLIIEPTVRRVPA